MSTSRKTLTIASCALLLSTSLAIAAEGSSNGAAVDSSMGSSEKMMHGTGAPSGSENGSMGRSMSGGAQGDATGATNPKRVGSEPGMSSGAGTAK